MKNQSFLTKSRLFLKRIVMILERCKTYISIRHQEFRWDKNKHPVAVTFLFSINNDILALFEKKLPEHSHSLQFCKLK